MAPATVQNTIMKPITEPLYVPHRALLSNAEAADLTYNFGGLPAPYLTTDGDTIATLCTTFGIDTDALRSANVKVSLPLNESVTVPAGVALTLPGLPAVPPMPTTITVKSLDEAMAFAKAYQVDLEDLEDANKEVLCTAQRCRGIAQTPLSQITTIVPGTTLRVPLPRHMVVPDCSPNDATVLCPRPAQSLDDLAATAGLTVDAILAANPHIAAQHNTLLLSQPLRRPGSAGSLPERVSVPAMGNAYDALSAAGDVALTLVGLEAVSSHNQYGTVERMLTVTNYSRVLELPAVTVGKDTLVDGSQPATGASDLRRRLSALSSVKAPLRGPIKSAPVADALRGRNLQTYGFSPAPQQPRNVEWFGRCGGVEETCAWNPWAFCQDSANPQVRGGKETHVVHNKTHAVHDRHAVHTPPAVITHIAFFLLLLLLLLP